MLKKDPLMLLSLAIVLLMAVSVTSTYAQASQRWEEPDAVLVGRVSHIEGQLMRYDAQHDHWIPTPEESPFGAGDRLRSAAETKAEFIFPNNMWVRIDADTPIRLVTLDPKLSELDLHAGNARFINRSTHGVIKSSTPFGHVTARPGAVFDLYIQQTGVEIVAVTGSVYFMHHTFTDPMEVRADASAIFADIHEVTTTPGDVKRAWNNWNAERNAMWAARTREKGRSAAYLPQQLHSEAYPLDRHGVWEKVYYENGYYHFWRPLHVHSGWAPFTAGTWMVWHGDHVWIPNETFGYVTHHYGNWLFTAGFWYWAPPVTRLTLRAHGSLLRIGFGWYPGRVAWIHSSAHLGWIPLAPNEPYFTHRHWGRRCIVVKKGRQYHGRGPHRYKHHRHAVVIHRSHMYRASHDRHSRVRHIPRNAIGNKFQTTPVLNTAEITAPRSRKIKDRSGTTRRPDKSRPQRYTPKKSQKSRVSRIQKHVNTLDATVVTGRKAPGLKTPHQRRNTAAKPSRPGGGASHVIPVPPSRKTVGSVPSRSYPSRNLTHRHGAVRQVQRSHSAVQKSGRGSSDAAKHGRRPRNR